MKKIFILFIAFAYLNSVAQKPTYTFSTEEAGRIVNYLASDEMKGRKIYSPEIDKAADFIADYFKKAGLKTYNNTTSYLQSFSMVSSKFKGITATINDEVIPAERVIVITGEPELVVTEKTGYETVYIAGGGNLFGESIAHMQSGKNKIILVDSSFSNHFKRLTFLKRNFFKTGNSIIFILGNPSLKTFTIKALHDIKDSKLSNVVGVLPGKTKPDEFVIFSAHYDHIGIGKTENSDSIYNGANDDASGTAAVMMLANYFSALNNNDRSIIFVAFTAEETGGFGSQYFSQQIPPEKAIAMINIEMIGTESKWGKNSAYITGFEKSSLGEILQKNLAGTCFTFHPDPYPTEKLFYRSDNATLAKLGVPAHTVSTSKMDNEPNYHHASDELKTLNLINMTEIIKAIGISATTIIAGKDMPSRVNKEDLR